jgi:hypothetical protein
MDKLKMHSLNLVLLILISLVADINLEFLHA